MIVVLLVAALVSVCWAQGACSNGCVWSCDTTRGQCADPRNKRVCVNVGDVRKRASPTTSGTILGEWTVGDQATITNGPVNADTYAWFELDSKVWSAFSSTNGVFWYTVCPGTPPFVPPTPTPPTPRPTPRPTPQPAAVQPPSPAATTTEIGSEPASTTGAVQQSTVPVIGPQCNAAFDKCCSPEGLIVPAGTTCFVKSAQCVLEMSACDGRLPNCPVVAAPNGQKCTTSAGQAGECVNSICQVATKACGPGAQAAMKQCVDACAKTSKSMKDICLCKETSMCWNTQRVENFIAGDGADAAKFTDQCPEFCVCSCAAAGDSSSGERVSALSIAAVFLSTAALVYV
jgi:hypothetical protein